jgi:hypothetical protein
MKHFGTAVLIGLLGACSSYQDTPGAVSQVDDRGRLTVSATKPFGRQPEPTARMIAQAREVCPNAVYISARPSTADFNTFEYLFRC